MKFHLKVGDVISVFNPDEREIIITEPVPSAWGFDDTRVWMCFIVACSGRVMRIYVNHNTEKVL